MAARALNPAQTAVLEEIAALSAKRKADRAVMRRRIAEQLQKELEALDLAIALGVRRAFDLGVPLGRIGRDGLDTTDPGTPRRWLERTEAAQQALDELVRPYTPLADGSVAVHVREFPTTATNAVDYPEILQGVVKRNGKRWEVVADPGTVETATGTLTGWLTWEIEHGTLPAALDEWEAGR